MPEIIIRQPAEPTMIDDLNAKKRHKKYTVFGMQDGKEVRRYDTDFDHEYICSTEKSREGIGPDQIVTVEHYNNKHLRNRDRLVKEKTVYPEHIREWGWTRKAQIVVPDGVYKKEPATQAENGKKAKAKE